MLMLLFQIQDEPWALSITEVKDLIPLVKLQPCADLGENIVGILNYHGEHLPVVDVSSLVASQRSPDAFSTRIAIVEIEDDSEADDSEADDSEADESEGAVASDALTEKASAESCVIKLGLILDRAYEAVDLAKTVDIPFQTFTDSTFIQSMLMNAEGLVVQQLALAPLLSKVRSSTLSSTPRPSPLEPQSIAA